MKTRFKLTALTLGIIVAVGVTEVGLRLLGLGFGSSPMEPDPFLHHVHPKSYTFVQQHPSGELGGFAIEYNAEGRVFRGHASPPPAGVGSPCRIALMGDSFVEAGQVPFAQSFAGLLEEAAGSRCEVRDYGTRSYSPAIYLVQWTRQIEQWHPTYTFVLIFGGDIREDVDYLTQAVMGSDGFPTAIQGPNDGWLVSQLRRSYVARLVRMVSQRAQWVYEHRGQPQWTVGGVVEENPQWGGPTPGLIRELNRRATNAGSHLVVMVVPSRYRLMGDGTLAVEHDLHASVQRWCADNGIAFLDLQTPFAKASRAGAALFFLQDIHFTAEGHAVVGGAIARLHPEIFGDAPNITGKAVIAAFRRDPP
jgi:hypothetical protein